MGHLSTSDRVGTKLSSCAAADAAAAAAQGNSGSSANGSPTLLKRANGHSNGNVPNGVGSSHSEKSSVSNGVSNGVANGAAVKKPPFEHVYHVNLDKYERDFKGDKVLGIQFKAPLKWDKVIQITLLHLVCLVCLVTYPLHKLTLYTSLWSFFTGGLAGFGVTAGAHRYWTHRSYKANVPLRIIMMACFSLAGQNTLFDWVRDHRVHHKYSETDADPHNSNRGFFFAHVGWLMMLKHPDVMRRGRALDMSDVLADPVVQFHQKYFIPLKTMLCFVLPTVIPVYFWGEEWYLSIVQQCMFRYVSSLNFTWLVNSAAHMWGTRPYDKRINPAENIYVSILAMGEGWHNYHHVFPWDYKAAELGKYSVNFSTMVLDFFNKIGWAWNMKEPSKELVRRTIQKYGDGTHELSQIPDVPDNHDGHCHYPEVPDPEFEDEAESSSTESSKLDENDNLKKKLTT